MCLANLTLLLLTIQPGKSFAPCALTPSVLPINYLYFSTALNTIVIFDLFVKGTFFLER